MRLVVQRVTRASVSVDEEIVGEISKGLCVLVGIRKDDTPADAEWCRDRILKTNFWPDDQGKPWKRSVATGGYDVLCVSQFTLFAEIKRKKGQKDLDFRNAMGSDAARVFYATFLDDLRTGLAADATLADGRFGAMMDVSLVNDGPVTLSLDSRDGNGLTPVDGPPPPDAATASAG
mmetsp:Transcript_11755/g.36261  ORF Transcript_11755/g.36261 Transcript_11755/m.36261 type:complete len:176 (+) Transcript_11755:161-688(+)